TARERVRAQREQAEQLKRRLETERAATEEAARLAVIRRHQIEAAQGVIEVLPAVLDTADRSVSEARVALAAAEADRAKQNGELAELRRTEAGLRERLAALNENVHGLEMQAYEKKLHLSSLLERAADELGLVEDVLVAEYGPHVPVPVDAPTASPSPAAATASAAPSPAAMSKMQENSEHPPENSGADADAEAGSPAFSTMEAGDDAPDAAQQTDAVATEPFDRAKQKARLEKAERKYAQLGRVNPLALEEFAALEQRHKFLTEQLADLTATRKDLLTIIDEIDEKMQDIFASAFADTKAAFDEVNALAKM